MWPDVVGCGTINNAVTVCWCIWTGWAHCCPEWDRFVGSLRSRPGGWPAHGRRGLSVHSLHGQDQGDVHAVSDLLMFQHTAPSYQPGPVWRYVRPYHPITIILIRMRVTPSRNPFASQLKCLLITGADSKPVVHTRNGGAEPTSWCSVTETSDACPALNIIFTSQTKGRLGNEKA